MAPVRILDHGLDMRSPIMKIDQLRVEGDLDSRQCTRMFQQHGFDEFLRDAMGQLRRAPFARKTAQSLPGVLCCGQAEAGDFLCAEAGEIGDVGGIIERQAKAPDFVGKAEAPVMLHRAGLRGVGLRIDRRA